MGSTLWVQRYGEPLTIWVRRYFIFLLLTTLLEPQYK